jgi:hypothetical protein
MSREPSSAASLLVPLSALCLAAVACLSPVHNDTWWHLAYGREMAAIGGFGQFDRFSYTAFGRPFPNHQWLSQRVFHGLYGLGGLPLLTAFCATLLTAGWVLCWRLSRGAIGDRLLIMAGAVAGSTLVWSIRPQVFSIVLLPLTVTLLVRDRLVWVPLVTLAWANLHGSVLLGLIAIAVWTAVERASRSPRWRRVAVTFVFSALSTFVTPIGAGYWPAVVASLGRSQRNSLHEWQAPGWPPEHLFLWAGATALILLGASRWRVLDVTGRALVATALVFFVSATRALRNIAPFMMMAGPALTALVERPSSLSRPRAPSRAAQVVMAVGVVAVTALVSVAWSKPWARLEWRPMSHEAAAAIRTCPPPIYNTYVGGGSIIWNVPEQRVFVDSRQDPFPDQVIRDATTIETGADPRGAIARYGFRCAAVPPESSVAATLSALGWRTSFRDDDWLVLIRP